MEYRRGDVRLWHFAGEEVLDVGLGKYAATRRYRVMVFGLRGECVHILDFGFEECSHLFDECARAAGAVAVHTDVGTLSLVEKNHFGVLATNVYESFYLWITP